MSFSPLRAAVERASKRKTRGARKTDCIQSVLTVHVEIVERKTEVHLSVLCLSVIG